MEKDNTKQLISDLTLSLAYLCSREEKSITGEPIYRARKGYDFDILDKLMEEGLIDFTYKVTRISGSANRSYPQLFRRLTSVEKPRSVMEYRNNVLLFSS